MPLESTILCLDVSEWMRNGDYPPSRVDGQYDAATMLCGAKIDANPESTVGILTAGGKGVSLLTSPTEDLGKLLACLHGLTPRGPSQLVAGIKTAMIALKHRKNKHGGQRIVAFVGSPLGTPVSEDDLKKLGAALKKNNVAIDVIAMGEQEDNAPKLQALVDAANASGNSNLLVVPPGMLPSEMLSSSPILLGEMAAGGGGGGAAGGGGGGGARFEEYGGIDPNLDPELALAMRISMEEARAAAESRDAAAGGGGSSSGGSGLVVPPSPVEPASSSSAAAAAAGGVGATPAGGERSSSVPSSAASIRLPPPGADASGGDVVMDEDALLQQALALSMAEGGGGGGAPAAPPAPAPAAPAADAAAAASQQAFSNPDFVAQLLGGLPGVDVNDPAIQEALRAMQQGGGGAGGAPPPAAPKKEDGEGK